MTSRTLSAVIVLVASLGSLSAAVAQRTKTPTLEEILERLEANLNRYDTRVPSLFCDEQVVSSQVAHGQRDEKTITDSVFRLKRTPNPDHTTILVESRDIKTIDGKPATSQKLDGPSLLNGAFEGGLAVVSLDQTACMSYTLERIDRNHPAEPYVIHFATVLTPHNIGACLLKENSKGSALIDSASMQITHLELNTPRHNIIPENSYRSRVVGKRELTVDYAPVQLNGETFWMPSSITLLNTSSPGTFHSIVWSFQATYSNYHKLEVTSHVVPASETYPKTAAPLR